MVLGGSVALFGSLGASSRSSVIARSVLPSWYQVAATGALSSGRLPPGDGQTDIP
jgi:hypothetical protein